MQFDPTPLGFDHPRTAHGRTAFDTPRVSADDRAELIVMQRVAADQLGEPVWTFPPLWASAGRPGDVLVAVAQRQQAAYLQRQADLHDAGEFRGSAPSAPAESAASTSPAYRALLAADLVMVDDVMPRAQAGTLRDSEQKRGRSSRVWVDEYLADRHKRGGRR